MLLPGYLLAAELFAVCLARLIPAKCPHLRLPVVYYPQHRHDESPMGKREEAMSNFCFAFPKELDSPVKIDDWAKRYLQDLTPKGRKAEDNVVDVIGPCARDVGFLTLEQFKEICMWKSPRPKHLYEQNEDEYIEEVTRIALSAPSERLRIQILTLLRGVSWRTASAILHLAHQDRYPIMDFRVMRTLGQEVQENFAFWWEYVELCRKIAEKHGVTMRTLDRALWKYAIEKGGETAANNSAAKGHLADE